MTDVFHPVVRVYVTPPSTRDWCRAGLNEEHTGVRGGNHSCWSPALGAWGCSWRCSRTRWGATPTAAADTTSSPQSWHTTRPPNTATVIQGVIELTKVHAQIVNAGDVPPQ